MEKSDRLIQISYMRVCAMILVVFYHCICCYSGIWQGFDFGASIIPFYEIIGNLLVNFHLPLFTIVAGFLFQHLKQKGYYTDKRLFLETNSYV